MYKILIAAVAFTLSMGTMSFTQQDEDQPKCYINDHTDEEITDEYLESVERLVIKVEGQRTVQSFQVTIAPKKGTAMVDQINGNRIPKHLHQKMIAATPGTKIILDQVKCISADGEIICKPMVYKKPKKEEE